MPRKKYVQSIVLTNVQRHASLAAEIKGESFFIKGKNGAGKSTLLRSLLLSLGSLPENDRPNSLLKTDEESGKIETVVVANGDTYVAEWRFSKKDTGRLKFSKLLDDGKKDELRPAMSRLAEIFGKVQDLTPLIDMSGEEQFESLKKILNIDTTGYKINRKNKLEDRRIIFRNIQSAKATILLPEYHFGESDRELYGDKPLKDAAVLMGTKKELEEFRSKVRLGELRMKMRKDLAKEITDIDNEIALLQKKRIEKEMALTNARPIDVKKAELELDQAEAFNKAIDLEVVELTEFNDKVTKVATLVRLEDEVLKEQQKWDDITVEIEKMDTDLSNSLATLPLEDVYPGFKLVYELDEEGKETKVGLELNGLPFRRTSQSLGEALKCLIRFSTYLNPEGLNLVCIGQWDLMDEQNQQEVLQMAAEDDTIQLAIEKVDNLSEIVIELVQK